MNGDINIQFQPNYDFKKEIMINFIKNPFLYFYQNKIIQNDFERFQQLNNLNGINSKSLNNPKKTEYTNIINENLNDYFDEEEKKKTEIMSEKNETNKELDLNIIKRKKLFEVKNQIIRRKRRKKKKMNKPRKDNIFKQIKVQTIKFIINTLNEQVEKVFNRFYKFKNTIEKEFKDNIQKNNNLKILTMKLQNILINNCIDDSNEKLIKKIKEKINNDENNENLIFINKLLNKKLIDIINMFGMEESEFLKEYGYYNKFLLKNYHNDYKNKEDMINLINYGMIQYLEDKNQRKPKKFYDIGE